MGTGFDCFDETAHTLNRTIGPSPRLHRALLKTIMEKHGFVNYDKEWWHYTLQGEPFPDTYFDFDVE
jgi:D-alanyl-D-alanine dipeptidase